MCETRLRQTCDGSNKRTETGGDGPVTSTPSTVAPWRHTAIVAPVSEAGSTGDVNSALSPLGQQPVQLVEHKPHRRDPVPDLHRWEPRYGQDCPFKVTNYARTIGKKFRTSLKSFGCDL